MAMPLLEFLIRRRIAAALAAPPTSPDPERSTPKQKGPDPDKSQSSTSGVDADQSPSCGC